MGLKSKEKLSKKLLIELIKRGIKEGKLQIVWRNGKPYLRRTPYTYKNPTKFQLMQRLRWAKTAYNHFGKKGTVTLPDGRRISRVAYELMNKTRGKLSPEKPQLININVIKYILREYEQD